MAGTLYANPLFASGMAGVLESFLGGNPREAAAAELYAAQAANENDTRAYRKQIGEMGDGGDMAGMMVRALQAGGEFGRVAPGIASGIAATPGSGYTPAQADRLAVGTGTQNAGGTFTGLADTLGNALEQTGMNTASRERIAADDRNAEAALAREGSTAFTQALRGITPNAQGALERLQGAVGPLKITSGYRDPEHNAAVGGAKGSQHIHGNAFDVDTSGMNDEARAALIMRAREAGFGGIGVYDGSLHFDVGGGRAWGPDYHRGSLPEWAAGAAGAPVGTGATAAPTDSIIDPRAIELLAAAGSPGVTPAQASILKGLADDMFPKPGKAPDPEELSGGGRAALIKALGDDASPQEAMALAASIDQLMNDQHMSENEALAYALNPDNQERGPDQVEEGPWYLPNFLGGETVTPGGITGLKAVGAAGRDAGAADGAADALAQAKAAIAAGRDRALVIKRLQEMGIDPAGL